MQVNSGGDNLKCARIVQSQQCSIDIPIKPQAHSLRVWVGVRPVLGQQPGFAVLHSTADEYNDGLWLG